jgi:signal transduction histidine kinase
MAADARAIDPDDPDRRIVAPKGGDELTDLGLAFNVLLGRLHESSERQRRFTGDASHQLRTPLAALLGQIEIALRRERTAEEYRDALMTAQAKATHLQRIIEALLFLTRANADAALEHRERLDLAAWLTEHVAAWTDHPRFRDIRLVGVRASLPVTTHPILLGEVVNILLDNACQYTPPGSDITLTLCREEESVRLEVRDRGPGISEADLAHIFAPFFRTAAALQANKGGVGLGLSIAHRLAETLGSPLSVVSHLGEGSCFVLAFSLDDHQTETEPSQDKGGR